MKAQKQIVLKLEVSDYTINQLQKNFGQEVTHGEVRVENKREWEKHEAKIKPELQWYCKYRELSESFRADMKQVGIQAFVSGNHIAFHDLNGSKDRFALFTLTNGKRDTL